MAISWSAPTPTRRGSEHDHDSDSEIPDGPGGPGGGVVHDLVDGRPGRGRPPLRPAAHGATPDPRPAPHQPPHPHGDLDRRVVSLPAQRPHPPPLARQDVLRSPRLRPALQRAALLGAGRGRQAPLTPSARPSGASSRPRRRVGSPGRAWRPLHPGHAACAAPWNWFARYVDQRQQALVRLFVDPCSTGSVAGGGVVLAKNLSARILFEGGVLTAARAASAFEGPPGVALGALAGCMTGVGAKGFADGQGPARPPEPARPRSPPAWLGRPGSAPAGAPRRSSPGPSGCWWSWCSGSSVPCCCVTWGSDDPQRVAVPSV